MKSYLLLFLLGLGTHDSCLSAWSGPGSKTFSPPPTSFTSWPDDLGYGDLSCYGQEKFSTPQLDQLARKEFALPAIMQAVRCVRPPVQC
jgi:hypothetical protein